MPEKQVTTVDSTQTVNQLLDSVRVLEEAVLKLQQKQSVLLKGLRWAAKETKSIYGLSTIGAIFEQLAEKLAE